MIPVGCFLAGILFSCVNDAGEVRQITYDPKNPDEVTHQLNVFFTDSGYPRIRLQAELSETYSTPKNIRKFRKGLKVDFFDVDGKKVSTLTAQYGEIQLDEMKMMVRDSVELYNFEKAQRLRTEELHWNQKDSIIYTDKNVTVTDPKSVLYGTGIRTKQDFSEYTFLYPKGKINLDK